MAQPRVLFHFKWVCAPLQAPPLSQPLSRKWREEQMPLGDHPPLLTGATRLCIYIT